VYTDTYTHPTSAQAVATPLLRNKSREKDIINLLDYKIDIALTLKLGMNGIFTYETKIYIIQKLLGKIYAKNSNCLEKETFLLAAFLLPSLD